MNTIMNELSLRMEEI